MTDPIADMIARINNASRVRKPEVTMPLSRIKKEIADILMSEGFVEDATASTEGFGTLTVKLKYLDDRTPAITHFSRISTPGRRVYASVGELPYVLNDFGIAILSTSHGVMTNKQARSQKLGGELLCKVY